jgi:hypothetical protein
LTQIFYGADRRVCVRVPPGRNMPSNLPALSSINRLPQVTISNPSNISTLALISGGELTQGIGYAPTTGTNAKTGLGFVS